MNSGRIARPAEEFLGPGGPAAVALAAYEDRPEQLEMAKAVSRALETRRHLIVEAGTGVGKSLAYLVPLVQWASASGERSVVSTHTKTLQEQLCRKDLPFLKDKLGVDFNFALCLGAENYVCLRRLASDCTYELFDNEVQFEDAKRIIEWSMATTTGIRADLGFEPKPGVWEKVCRDADLCHGARCSSKNGCFYRKAKRRERDADILVVNHALFFTNLASGGNVLPSFGAAVFDEAHTLEDVATSYLGSEVANTQVAYLFNSIHHQRTGRGALARFKDASEPYKEARRCLEDARAASHRFFASLAAKFGAASDVRRIRSKRVVEDSLGGPLNRLVGALEELAKYARTAGDNDLIRSCAKKCVALKATLAFLLEMVWYFYFCWLLVAGGWLGGRYRLAAAPVEIAEALKVQLFDLVRPVILTSATLASGGDFSFIQKRLGLQDCAELLLGSPFDYAANAALYIPPKITDPVEAPERFREEVLRHTSEILNVMGGRTFVLFTSYRMLEYVHEGLKTWSPDVVLLRQGEAPRYKLLAQFKRDERAVLLGTTTFWQGIDVPGRALECVVITKLPFAVPDDPITEARAELITARGGNPFAEFQVPQAVMMFKQGFGRLIRTKTDRGVVAVLDPRVKTRFYGRTFLKALPKCRQLSTLKEVKDFFAPTSIRG